MKLIFPDEVWSHVRLPEVPTTEISETRLNAEQNERLSAALSILRMFHKPCGQRRSNYDLNRIAQRTCPEFGWTITEVETVARVWRIAGIDSLVDSILQANAKLDFGCRFAFESIELVEFGAKESPYDVPNEAFVSTHYVSARARDPELRWQPYRVAAKTKYGKYLFYVATHEPPTVWTVREYCIEHNRVANKKE